jgi:hypothetical protein
VKLREVNRALLVAAVLSAADGGQDFRHELAWVVPPGWIPIENRGQHLGAGDPHDPFATVTVIHIPASAGRPMDVDFLRKALERFPSSKRPIVGAMLGTCSDGRLRFACEEVQIRDSSRLEVAYAWVDERRGSGFSARYTVPAGREEELLPLVRRVVGWKATKVIEQ